VSLPLAGIQRKVYTELLYRQYLIRLADTTSVLWVDIDIGDQSDGIIFQFGDHS